MKKMMMAAFALVAASVCAGPSWTNFDDAHHICGPKVSPASFAGKVVLVDRWNYKCHSCIRSLSEMQSYLQKYGDRGLVVIGSHISNGTKEQAAQVVKSKGATFPVYQECGIANAPATRGIPAPYIIGVDGKMVWASSGGLNKEDLEKALKVAMRKLPAVLHDLLLEDVKELAEKRPGLALLRAEEFAKKFPKEKDLVKEARAALAANAEVKKLMALEQTLEKFEGKKPSASEVNAAVRKAEGLLNATVPGGAMEARILIIKFKNMAPQKPAKK